jgi:hypothetical protein
MTPIEIATTLRLGARPLEVSMRTCQARRSIRRVSFSMRSRRGS